MVLASEVARYFVAATGLGWKTIRNDIITRGGGISRYWSTYHVAVVRLVYVLRGRVARLPDSSLS
ncbi:MAG: hypothetical protein M3O50_04525 [Myxococcota bacterium]|nr:hypothetical protein [Myxococcota bacterium]